MTKHVPPDELFDRVRDFERQLGKDYSAEQICEVMLSQSIETFSKINGRRRAAERLYLLAMTLGKAAKNSMPLPPAGNA